MQPNTKKKISGIAMLIVIYFLAFCLGVVIERYLNQNQEEIPHFFSGEEQLAEVMEDCKGKLGIEPKLKCFNGYVNSIFNYTLTDDSLNLSLDELKENGGDCYNWAKFYCFAGEELGFNCDLITINKTNSSAHMFALIYSEEGYCVTDQKDIHCFIYREQQIKEAQK